jgi:hypothetical protein
MASEYITDTGVRWPDNSCLLVGNTYQLSTSGEQILYDPLSASLITKVIFDGPTTGH